MVRGGGIYLFSLLRSGFDALINFLNVLDFLTQKFGGRFLDSCKKLKNIFIEGLNLICRISFFVLSFLSWDFVCSLLECVIDGIGVFKTQLSAYILYLLLV